MTVGIKADSHIHTCMIHNTSHDLWVSGLWKCTNAPFSNFRVSVFQFDQEETGGGGPCHTGLSSFLSSAKSDLPHWSDLRRQTAARQGPRYLQRLFLPPPPPPRPRLFFWSVHYLKQAEQLVSLCASSCGDRVSGITLLRMSFSVAIMCLTRKLAASLMLRLS